MWKEGRRLFRDPAWMIQQERMVEAPHLSRVGRRGDFGSRKDLFLLYFLATRLFSSFYLAFPPASQGSLTSFP